MHLAPLTPAAYPDLAALLTAQLGAMPPGLTFDADSVAAALAGEDYWQVFYADEVTPSYETERVGVFSGGRLLAAASCRWPDRADVGWYWDRDYRQAFPNWAADGRTLTQVVWLAAAPEAPEALDRLLPTLLAEARARGHHRLDLNGRNPFGLGWQGVPGHWTHVLDALRRAEAPGVRLAPPDRWQLATRDLADLPAAGPLPEGVELHWRPANGAPETTLLASEAGRAVAECQVWEVPPHLADAADWCCVEWLGVDETQRRRGLGAHLVRAQLARQAQQGKRHAALWTQVDNAPVRRLNERLGFRLGPECWQLHYQLDPV